MHLVVNALSTTNLSGAHVLGGHLAEWEREKRFSRGLTLLCHSGNATLFQQFAPSARVHLCPDSTRRWTGRAVWQRLRLPGVLAALKADVLLSGSGMRSCRSPIPEVTYAMNPWALVPGLATGWAEGGKAALQRRAYAEASRTCAGIVFLSAYMQEAYRANAGRPEQSGRVVYTGLPGDVLDPEISGGTPRDARRIVSGSAMARHKGVEYLLAAMAELRFRRGSSATLLLMGGWPDPAYRREMEELCARLGLQGTVEFRGHVDRAVWVRELASARVFCLMTRCESFGIPAVEAQALGTPVVSSNRCAVPEVCGEGGLYTDPHDSAATADALHLLLTDDEKWKTTSGLARCNASRYNWARQAAALAEYLEQVATSRP